MDARVMPCLVVALSTFAAAFELMGTDGVRARPRRPYSSEWKVAADIVKRLPMVREVRAASQRAELRSSAIRELPTLLDVVTLGLSSGLSFDASLELYCQHYDTALSKAFFEAMLSWRLGIQSRAAALDSLARSMDVAALRRFSAAVSQALEFGSPLAEVLEQQAQTIRDEQRSEMEAEIERVPVKMLIPLGTLIVPAMLLSILGPLLGSTLSFG